jgi:hypothetical protein
MQVNFKNGQNLVIEDYLKLVIRFIKAYTEVLRTFIRIRIWLFTLPLFQIHADPNLPLMLQKKFYPPA